MRQPLVLSLCLLGGATPALSQVGRLGTIEFPTSGSAMAQSHFLRGALFLHSFEYDSAATEFRAAQQVAPGFAMAYWGEAMTYNHPVWDQQDRSAALAALGRLATTPGERSAKAPTHREQAWLHAVEALYGEGSKAHRDTVYERAMESIAKEWPTDLEAQTFHALALLGLSRTTRVIPTYMRAGAIALDAMAKNPDHPGAAHYAIHAFDDPIHAALGLPAARAYSRIAPGAAHAQHMTTHIFLALGMWDDVVRQNVIASGTEKARWMPGHYTIWLGYGLLQQGRFAAAADHLALVRRNMAEDESPGRRGAYLLMQSDFLVNTERWADSAALASVDAQGVGPVPLVVNAFARGLAAFKLGDIALARRQLDGIQSLNTSSTPISAAQVLARELQGLIRMSEGDSAGGIALLREATAIEDTLPMEFGPPAIVKPSHELLGEILLAQGKDSDARQQFESALRLAPRRMRSLLGLSRAAFRGNNEEVARMASHQLLDVMDQSDTTLKEKGEIRTMLNALEHN